jgi:hypothetical protein
VTVTQRNASNIASPPIGTIVGNMTDVEQARGYRKKGDRKTARERATLGIATLG